MKRYINIATIEELRQVVEDLILSGEHKVNLKLNPVLLAEPEVHDILERIVTHHPRSQPDVEEVVSYSQDAVHSHEGIRYRIDRNPDGFRVKILTPCGGEMEPWDFALSTFDDAAAHAHAYIDQLENQENLQ